MTEDTHTAVDDTSNATDRLSRVQALVRRRGTPAAATAEPMVAEIRSNDEISLRPGDPALDYVIGTLIVEWSFGVPYGDAEAFHTFLKGNEKFIADACRATMQGVLYLGTYWSVGLGQGYRTYWAYDNADAMNQWANALSSAQLATAIHELRSYWARDPGRGERHLQPAALFTDLTDSIADNPFVAASIAAAKK